MQDVDPQFVEGHYENERKTCCSILCGFGLLGVFFVETSEHESRGKAVKGVSPDGNLRARCFRLKDGVGHYRFEFTLDDILNGDRLKLGTGSFAESAYQRSESPMPVIFWPDGNKKVVFVFDDIEIVMNAVSLGNP